MLLPKKHRQPVPDDLFFFGAVAIAGYYALDNGTYIIG